MSPQQACYEPCLKAVQLGFGAAALIVVNAQQFVIRGHVPLSPHSSSLLGIELLMAWKYSSSLSILALVAVMIMELQDPEHSRLDSRDPNPILDKKKRAIIRGGRRTILLASKVLNIQLRSGGIRPELKGQRQPRRYWTGHLGGRRVWSVHGIYRETFSTQGAGGVFSWCSHVASRACCWSWPRSKLHRPRCTDAVRTNSNKSSSSAAASYKEHEIPTWRQYESPSLSSTTAPPAKPKYNTDPLGSFALAPKA